MSRRDNTVSPLVWAAMNDGCTFKHAIIDDEVHTWLTVPCPRGTAREFHSCRRDRVSSEADAALSYGREFWDEGKLLGRIEDHLKWNLRRQKT